MLVGIGLVDVVYKVVDIIVKVLVIFLEYLMNVVIEGIDVIVYIRV